MPHLTPQEEKVYTYIKNHYGCTSHDITRDTFIQKPCARISSLRQKGIDIQEVGHVKYEGTRAFVRYAIGKPLTKKVSRFEIVDGVAREIIEEVTV